MSVQAKQHLVLQTDFFYLHADQGMKCTAHREEEESFISLFVDLPEYWRCIGKKSLKVDGIYFDCLITRRACV